MSEHHPSEMHFGDVLPEQTSDDVDAPEEQDDPEDLRRFLDDKPPHHVD